MGECGCTSNDDKYSFPGPGKSFYVLTLAGACENCDAPPGVSIERIDPNNILYDDYRRGKFLNGLLKFQKWPDSLGVGIVTGMDKSGFIKALMSHLVGVRSDELGENGAIDEAGADVILEEMYSDAAFKPQIAGDRQEANANQLEQPTH